MNGWGQERRIKSLTIRAPRLASVDKGRLLCDASLRVFHCLSVSPAISKKRQTEEVDAVPAHSISLYASSRTGHRFEGFARLHSAYSPPTRSIQQVHCSSQAILALISNLHRLPFGPIAYRCAGDPNCWALRHLIGSCGTWRSIAQNSLILFFRFYSSFLLLIFRILSNLRGRAVAEQVIITNWSSSRPVHSPQRWSSLPRDLPIANPSGGGG